MDRSGSLAHHSLWERLAGREESRRSANHDYSGGARVIEDIAVWARVGGGVDASAP
jgi:hypothetical protein